VLRFEVIDDGAGFDGATQAPGAGLTGARDRLEALGGELRVEAELGRGMRLAASIPLYEPSSAR
jgi:two-component system sensor histidine kinase DesK